MVDTILMTDSQHLLTSDMFRSRPILDNVIDYDGNVSQNPDNEKFISNEIGGEYRSELVAIKGSYYNTQWKDRNLTKSVTTGQGDSGDTDIIYLTGVNQSHSGLEIESKVSTRNGRLRCRC